MSEAALQPRLEQRALRVPVGLVFSLLFHGSLLVALAFLTIPVPEKAPDLSSDVPLNVAFLQTEPRVPEPVFEPAPLAAPKEITPIAAPDLALAEARISENSEAVNGFEDVADGGTEIVLDEPARSGGGGGDDAAARELGHIKIEDAAWSKFALTHVERVVGADGASEKPAIPGVLPGTLAAAGAGHGLGSGTGSGAAFSSGSGSGSGAGVNGIGRGDGIGMAKRGGISREPRPIRVERGAYPSSAMRAGHEGIVKVWVEILTNGCVGEVSLHSSSGYDDLDEAALESAKKWVFQPMLSDGEAVAARRVIPFKYVLVTR